MGITVEQLGKLQAALRGASYEEVARLLETKKFRSEMRKSLA
jgi:hypothetical protein